MKQELKVATLRAPKPFKAGETLPSRLKIFNWGLNQSNQGDFLVDDLSAKVLAENQRLIGRERIPIGFEHNIDPGSPEYERTKEPRPIAGQGKVAILSGDGIYLEDNNWTKEGIEGAPHYEDISPTPVYDSKTRRVVALLSVSLTRTGSVYDLTLAAAAQSAVATLSASSIANPKDQDQTMKSEFLSIASLAAALSLPADAPDLEARIIAKLSAAPAAPVLDPDRIIIVLKQGDREEKLSASQLAARLVKLENDFFATRQDATSAERNTLIARLNADGKSPINPETNKPYTPEALGKLDIATLKLLAVNTPSTVPLSARTRLAGAEGGALDASLKGSARVMAAFERDNAAAAHAN